jgi:hypothetical protein
MPAIALAKAIPYKKGEIIIKKEVLKLKNKKACPS